MPTRKEVLEIGGREVTVTNPDKVYFPDAGYTKLDLVSYYLAVADGALRGAGGRPMALKRFVDGDRRRRSSRSARPTTGPTGCASPTLTFPSGRTADEIVIDDAAGLAWVANLGCIDLNPHPVRADDLDHPDELRVDLDPVPGVEWPQIRDVALVAQEALEAVGLVGWPKTSGSRGIHINVRIERALDLPGGPAGGARARPRRRGAGAGDRHEQVVEGGAPRRLPRLQPERQGPDGRVGLLRPAAARCPGLDAAPLGRRSPTSRPRSSRSPPCRRCTPTRGDAGAGIDEAVGSLEALLELSARHEAEGQGDAPWPPNYAKQEGEPPRVQPSQGAPPEDRVRARAEASAAGRRRRSPRSGRPRSPPATATRACRPSGKARARRRPGAARSNIPVIEISRAATKAEALEGLERWKARHPEAAAAPRAGRRPGRRHARPLVALVPGPGQPDPRPGGRPARPGAARPGLRPVGRLRVARPRRPAGARAAEEGRSS